MDAAKIIWLLYEHPEVKFEGLALRFMDIRKRIYSFPDMGKKAELVCIPTTSGTGSEVTPFAIITDENTGMKWAIADYALTPTMAIVDSELAMGQPKGLTASCGIDVLTHALEALVSSMSTDFTNPLALEAARIVFKYLPQAYADGTNKKAREKMHDASTMAGMAFSNAFLGLCHSMAHKLGAAFHVPHGMANALLLTNIIRFNANDNPTKQASFPQYEYPSVISRYARAADYISMALNDTKNTDFIVTTPKMSMEDARTYFLAQKTYFVHERAKAYQEQFLSDLSRKDRSYVRTRTGVTYKILELGDQSIQNMSVRDTVLYAYTLTDDTGRVIVESDTLRTAYRQLPDGLQEVVRIAGDKGRFDAWLPSSTAYDTAGNAELGIAPDQLLNYRVDIIRIDYYNADKRR